MGGKLDAKLDGNDVMHCAMRECEEECGLRPIRLHLRGVLQFYYQQDSGWNNQCYVVESWHWSGSAPVESDEMFPAWIPVDSIDYSVLWEDDQHWLPQIDLQAPTPPAASSGSSQLFFYSFHFDLAGKLDRVVKHSAAEWGPLEVPLGWADPKAILQ